MKLTGGRKYTLAMLVVILTGILVYFTKITDGVYASVVIGTAGAYITGNVYQHTKEKTDEIPKTP